MEVTSTPIMRASLRAIIDIVRLYVAFDKMAKNVIKILIRIWSKKAHDCRCLAFVALTKIIRFNPTLYATIYKVCLSSAYRYYQFYYRDVTLHMLLVLDLSLLVVYLLCPL